MSCKGLTKALGGGDVCKTGMAGIKNLWIAGYNSDHSKIANFGADDQQKDFRKYAVKSIDPSVVFYRFELPIDLGDFSENASVDAKLGTSFVDQSINGTLLGLSKEDSKRLSGMMKDRQFVIAELYNTEELNVGTSSVPSLEKFSKFFLLGEMNGLDMTGGGSRTGAEASSLQGYEITWTGKERRYANQVDGRGIKLAAGSDSFTVNETANYPAS